MATALTDLVLKVGSITSLGYQDINADDAVPRQKPGTIGILIDAFGPRIVQYIKNKRGSALALAALASKVANVSVANITSGTTTSATTTGLTALAHDGKLCYVLDNDDSAGAAPEGETSVVTSNTTTVIKVEPSYPFSVALAANDDLTLISNWQATAAADGDLGHNVLGVCVGNAGISDTQYGWVQKEGFCPRVAMKNSAVVAGDPVVADTAQIGPFGTDGQELWVGIALAGFTSDQVSRIAPINLKLFTCAGPGTAP